jgi:hypothetical protein
VERDVVRPAEARERREETVPHIAPAMSIARNGAIGASSGALTPEEYDESFACFGTEDYRTGYRAFLAKRKPEFHGE